MIEDLALSRTALMGSWPHFPVFVVLRMTRQTLIISFVSSFLYHSAFADIPLPLSFSSPFTPFFAFASPCPSASFFAFASPCPSASFFAFAFRHALCLLQHFLSLPHPPPYPHHQVRIRRTIGDSRLAALAVQFELPRGSLLSKCVPLCTTTGTGLLPPSSPSLFLNARRRLKLVPRVLDTPEPVLGLIS